MHHCLSCHSMLGLFLTTTSLPPPVWTHIFSCLFKLHRVMVNCSSHRISVVCIPLFPGCWFLSDHFLLFRLQMSFWSDLLLIFCLSIVNNRFMCQFYFYIRRTLVLFSGNLFPYPSYLFLVRFIISILLMYHPFIEHLFPEIYYIYVTLSNRVVFFFLIVLFRFNCLAVHIILSSVAAFFC